MCLESRGTGTSGASSAVVAILDTGVNNHFSYQERLLNGVDMVTDEISANDGDGRDMNAEDPGDYLPYDKVCADGELAFNFLMAWKSRGRNCQYE